jgi:riboflavin-specific deaminase-like protein
MFVFSNLATSLDGKIASADRGLFPLGTPADRRQMQVLRKRADAVLMGASTLRAYKGPLKIRGEKAAPLNVIVSSTLSGISPSWSFFKEPKIGRLLFVSKKIDATRRRKFGKVAELFLLDPRKATAPQIVDELSRRGIKKLLVEGGGSVMWDFASADLLDELHVTLTPWVVGGADAPTLVDGRGFSSGRGLKLKLASVRRLRDELYLVYRRTLKSTRGSGR